MHLVVQITSNAPHKCKFNQGNLVTKTQV